MGGGESSEPRVPGGAERAGRRTSCAGRAVMLAAVQSLRLAGWEGLTPTGSCVIMLGTGGTASGSRDPRLFTGRPYGTGAWGGDKRRDAATTLGVVRRGRVGALRARGEL